MAHTFARTLAVTATLAILLSACGGASVPAPTSTDAQAADKGKAQRSTEMRPAPTVAAASQGPRTSPLATQTARAANGRFTPNQDGGTVYDATENVTWLADSDLAARQRFGLPACTGSGDVVCVNASGSMRYDAAVAWVEAMNAARYMGHSDWQLPTTPSVDDTCPHTGPHGNSFGFGCTASALGSLYRGLGVAAPNTAVPMPSGDAAPFRDLQPYLYWSQTSSGGQNSDGISTFSFATGFQGANTKPNFLYVWPAIKGRIPGIPAAAGTRLQVDPAGRTVYDPMTDFTWLADADLAASNAFGLERCADPTTPTLCVAQDGAMTWDAANKFIANMNADGGIGYLGQKSWELAPVDPNCPNYRCDGARDPMGNLFYDQLGLNQGSPAVAVPDIAVGAFHHVQPYLYWACEAATIQEVCQGGGPAPDFEWSFSFGNGFQGTDLLGNALYVTAYFPGPPRP